MADTIHDIKKSWQFQLLYTVSQLAAGGAEHSPHIKILYFGWQWCRVESPLMKHNISSPVRMYPINFTPQLEHTPPPRHTHTTHTHTYYTSTAMRHSTK